MANRKGKALSLERSAFASKPNANMDVESSPANRMAFAATARASTVGGSDAVGANAWANIGTTKAKMKMKTCQKANLISVKEAWFP